VLKKTVRRKLSDFIAVQISKTASSLLQVIFFSLECILKQNKKTANHAHLPALDYPLYYLLANRYRRFDPLPFCMATSASLQNSWICY
jgi:hypothetical protein